MGRTNATARIARAAILFASTAGMILPAFFVSAETPAPCLRVIAPPDGASLPEGNILVIGTVRGVGTAPVEIDVNGRGKKRVDAGSGGFSTIVALSSGKNVIRLTAGRNSVSVGVTGGGAGGRYRYHPDVERCAGCHERKGGYGVGARKDAVCYRCHKRQDGKKHIHGPLGSGECTACHDPHGSMNTALTVARTETMCVMCHDQESSAAHMKRSRGKPCTACHDPHSSDQSFLRR